MRLLCAEIDLVHLHEARVDHIQDLAVRGAVGELLHIGDLQPQELVEPIEELEARE